MPFNFIFIETFIANIWVKTWIFYISTTQNELLLRQKTEPGRRRPAAPVVRRRRKNPACLFILCVLGFKALMALFVGQQPSLATGLELALENYAKQLSWRSQDSALLPPLMRESVKYWSWWLAIIAAAAASAHISCSVFVFLCYLFSSASSAWNAPASDDACASNSWKKSLEPRGGARGEKTLESVKTLRLFPECLRSRADRPFPHSLLACSPDFISNLSALTHFYIQLAPRDSTWLMRFGLVIYLFSFLLSLSINSARKSKSCDQTLQCIYIMTKILKSIKLRAFNFF